MCCDVMMIDYSTIISQLKKEEHSYSNSTRALWRTNLEDSSIMKTVAQEYSGIQRELHTDSKTTTTTGDSVEDSVED